MAATTYAQQIVRDEPPGALGELPEKYWEIIERHRAELVGQALSILGNVQDAEDVVQETFCEVVRHSDRLARAESLGAWLRGVNRNKALRHLRDKRRDSKRAPAQMGTQELSTTGGFSGIELREALARQIKTLPPNMLQAVMLRYWEHLSCEDIAQRMNTPVGTVKWLLYEAVMRLHQNMTAAQSDGAAPAKKERA